MVDTLHQLARGYMESSTNGMLPHFCHLIRLMLLMDIVHLDQWSAYRQVLGLPNVAAHETLNHTVMFIGPVTGTHTHNIESYRGNTKRKLKRMKGSHVSQYPSYLDKFMWCELFGQTKADSFMNIISMVPFLPACASEQGNVIGLVSVYIYIVVIKKKL